MGTFIVKTKDANESKLLMEMLKKMRIESKSLSEKDEDDLEDTLFGKILDKVDRTETVSREEVMAKLRKK